MVRIARIECPEECPYRSGSSEDGECFHDDAIDMKCIGSEWPDDCPLDMEK